MNQSKSMLKKEKILVAMSGGVDSSVVAALLVDQGYDVTGMFAVNYDTDDADIYADDANHADNTNKKSCWRPDYQDALRVSAHLGIPLLRWDFTKEYKKMVLEYMYKEYEKGRTPNPDVMCNKFVKFGVWLDKAKKMGFDKIATGHYAQIRNKEKGISLPTQAGNKAKKTLTPYSLLLSKDENKDQTYFLHQLNQEQLSRVLFPIGEYTKPEVRKLAKKYKLPTAEKEESMGICFVGEVNMRDFLENKIKSKVGDVIKSSGEIVGKHEGLSFYTVGQRHMGLKTYDLRLMTERPLFVVDKNIKKNQLVVGYEDDPLLYKKEIVVEDVNWIGQEPKFPLKCKVRMRHRQELKDCVVDDNKVIFNKPERAVTPGQFAVFYKDNECLGGGVVK